jgi:HD-GYP domain-containing protein (c-di-GMP phosphodiesterase class II)
LAIRTGKAQYIQDIGHDPAMAPWQEKALAYGYKASIALPLFENDKPFGALTIYAAQPNAFDAKEIALLEEMAGDLGYGIHMQRVGIERDLSQAEQKHTLVQLRESLVGTVQAIAATVEKRDPYTAGHQRRVAELAVAIARELNFPDDQVQGISMAGIIHDLGKINVPAEILSNPGKITDIEYSLIKAHPQSGYDILKDVKFPWPIADVVLQHHERLDGSGYPQGLKDEQILPEAKIIAVADVVEAMSSHRPYRAGLGIERALEEIERNRGKLYDPEVVDACIRLFREQNFRLVKEGDSVL